MSRVKLQGFLAFSPVSFFFFSSLGYINRASFYEFNSFVSFFPVWARMPRLDCSWGLVSYNLSIRILFLSHQVRFIVLPFQHVRNGYTKYVHP